MFALRGLFPETGAAPEELASREAAQRLFSRLLAAAGSAEQYGALAALLGDTWRDGGAWEAPEGGEAREEGASQLCDSWAALHARMLASGAAACVLGQLDAARAAAAAGLGTARAALVSEWQAAQLAAQAPSPACALCLRLLSAHEALRGEALRQLAQESECVGLGDPFAPQLLVLLLAQPGAFAALLQAPAMAQLLQALQQLPLSPASCGGRAPAEAAVVPAVVSELLAAGQPGLAAAVVAQAARLHPSLSGFDGGLAVLQRFLMGCKDSCGGWAQQPAGGAVAASGTALLQRLPGLLKSALAELAQLLKAQGRGSAANE
jgi:hypothetical protein